MNNIWLSCCLRGSQNRFRNIFFSKILCDYNWFVTALAPTCRPNLMDLRIFIQTHIHPKNFLCYCLFLFLIEINRLKMTYTTLAIKKNYIPKLYEKKNILSVLTLIVIYGFPRRHWFDCMQKYSTSRLPPAPYQNHTHAACYRHEFCTFAYTILFSYDAFTAGW